MSFLGAQLDKEIPTLDLHGQSRNNAAYELETFIDQAWHTGARYVKVIHGRGMGALQEAVRSILSSHTLVKTFEPSEVPHEVGGVMYAHLKRNT